MQKSGCCYHEFSEFVVENNQPKAVKISTDEQDLPFEVTTDQTWNGKEMIMNSIRTIDLEQDGIKVILAFTVPKNGKQIILYNINDRTLNYAAVNKDSAVEFYYPVETVYENPDFKFDSTSINRTVTFVNDNATYKVYDKPNAVGIEITVNNKTYNWIGDMKSKQGSLTSLLRVHLDNVVNH